LLVSLGILQSPSEFHQKMNDDSTHTTGHLLSTTNTQELPKCNAPSSRVSFNVQQNEWIGSHQVGPGVVCAFFVWEECRAHLTGIQWVLLTSAYTATAAFQIVPHKETQWSKNNAGTCGWLKEFPVVSMLLFCLMTEYLLNHLWGKSPHRQLWIKCIKTVAVWVSLRHR